MAYPGRLTEKGVFKTAERLGIDLDRLREAMESPEIAETLAATRTSPRPWGLPEPLPS